MTSALQSKKGEALLMNGRPSTKAYSSAMSRAQSRSTRACCSGAKETGVSARSRPATSAWSMRPDVSTNAVSPKRMLNLLVGLVGGLSVESRSPSFRVHGYRLKSPEELEKHLGLPSIGLIPKLTGEYAAKDRSSTTARAPNFPKRSRAPHERDVLVR